MKQAFYIVISIAVISIVTLFTLYFQIQKRISNLYYEFVEEANSGNYENFLRYQNLYHHKYLEEESSDYQIIFYITVDQENPLKSHYLVLVKPLNEVNHATKPDDKKDQTKATATVGSTTYDSTDLSIHGEFPTSYGLVKNKFYYYHLIPISSDHNLDIALFDYDGNIIYQKEIETTVELSKENIENTFIKGFTSQEVTKLMRRNSSYLTLVYVVFGVAVAISLAGGIYYFKKWNLDKKQAKLN